MRTFASVVPSRIVKTLRRPATPKYTNAVSMLRVARTKGQAAVSYVCLTRMSSQFRALSYGA